MGLSRGELREELHAFEQRLNKRFNDIDTRFKDVMERINKSLDVLLSRVKDLPPTA